MHAFTSVNRINNNNKQQQQTTTINNNKNRRDNKPWLNLYPNSSIVSGNVGSGFSVFSPPKKEIQRTKKQIFFLYVTLIGKPNSPERLHILQQQQQQQKQREGCKCLWVSCTLGDLLIGTDTRLQLSNSNKVHRSNSSACFICCFTYDLIP